MKEHYACELMHTISRNTTENGGKTINKSSQVTKQPGEVLSKIIMILQPMDILGYPKLLISSANTSGGPNLHQKSKYMSRGAQSVNRTISTPKHVKHPYLPSIWIQKQPHFPQSHLTLSSSFQLPMGTILFSLSPIRAVPKWPY